MIYKGTWYHEGKPALHNSYVVETYGSPGGHAAKRPGSINPERWFRVKGRQLEVCNSTGQIMRHWAEKMTPQERLDWYAWADGRQFKTREGDVTILWGHVAFYHQTHHALCGNLSWLDSPPDFPPLIAVFEERLLIHYKPLYGRYWYRSWDPAYIYDWSTCTIQQIHPSAIGKDYDRYWTRQVLSLQPWPNVDHEWHCHDFDLWFRPASYEKLAVLRHYYAGPGHRWDVLQAGTAWPGPD